MTHDFEDIEVKQNCVTLLEKALMSIGSYFKRPAVT